MCIKYMMAFTALLMVLAWVLTGCAPMPVKGNAKFCHDDFHHNVRDCTYDKISECREQLKYGGLCRRR